MGKNQHSKTVDGLMTRCMTFFIMYAKPVVGELSVPWSRRHYPQMQSISSSNWVINSLVVWLVDGWPVAASDEASVAVNDFQAAFSDAFCGLSGFNITTP
ncbi:MAG: hypothetical protein G5701_10330, partial [Serratia symbiotica]|nr:hypothetical protein [Serratia symbiotica]